MAEQRFGSMYRKNILDERVLSLSTVNEQGKRASFGLRISGNKVRLAVWTGIENDDNGGKMGADLDLTTAFGMVSTVEHVLNNPNDTVVGFKILRLGKDGWKGGKLEAGNLLVGRRDGVIWISFMQRNRPNIKFQFIDDQWFNLMSKGGEKLSAKDSSDIVARAWVNSAYAYFASVSTQEYVDKEKNSGQSPNRNKGNNNGWKSNNQSNGNYNNRSNQSQDDDFGGFNDTPKQQAKDDINSGLDGAYDDDIDF